MYGEIIDWERKGDKIKFYLGRNGEQTGNNWGVVPWKGNAGRVYDEYIEYAVLLTFEIWDKKWEPLLRKHNIIRVYEGTIENIIYLSTSKIFIYEPQKYYSKRDLVNRIVPCVILSKIRFSSFQEALRDRKAKRYYFGDII